MLKVCLSNRLLIKLVEFIEEWLKLQITSANKMQDYSKKSVQLMQVTEIIDINFSNKPKWVSRSPVKFAKWLKSEKKVIEVKS